MNPILLKLLTFLTLFFHFNSQAQEIWGESFSVPDKGVWGSNDTSLINTNFEGVSTWTLDYSNINPDNPEDYAKTVTTSGGRFECKDINGEVIWYSEEIDISAYKDVKVELIAQETGSGANENTKYLKAFYKLDDGAEIQFETKGENLGNWGIDTVYQSGLNGDNLQIVVRMCNFYSADKVILDEIVVSGEEKNPVVINSGDALINEILFNPIPNGEDYVELYNNSEKEIPVNKLYLASRDNDLELTQIYSLTTENIIFEPQTYLVLTKDTNGVFPWFSIECPECFLQMSQFPSFNNDEDYVVLLNNEMLVIDEFFYNEDMHASLLYDVEGVSLERSSFSVSTNEPSNWHSASTESGYGTPGYKNSQFLPEDLQKISVSFEPESFSPNSDGYNDVYSVNLELDQPGYIANIWIYDSVGRQVTQLAKNNILGTSEQIIWNGKDGSGNTLRLGVYVVLVEIFNTEGYVKRFKDGVVLTKILK